MPRTRNAWTPERVAQLRKLHAALKAEDPRNYRQHLAKALGVPMGPLVGRLGREFKNGTLESSNPEPRPQRRRALPPPVEPPPPAPLKAAPAPPPSLPAVTHPVRVSPARRCQWPLWGLQTPRPLRDPRFCDQPSLGTCSYCEAHAGIAYYRFRGGLDP